MGKTQRNVHKKTIAPKPKKPAARRRKQFRDMTARADYEEAICPGVRPDVNVTPDYAFVRSHPINMGHHASHDKLVVIASSLAPCKQVPVGTLEDHMTTAATAANSVEGQSKLARYFEACTKQVRRRGELRPFRGHTRAVRRYDEPDKRRDEQRLARVHQIA